MLYFCIQLKEVEEQWIGMTYGKEKEDEVEIWAKWI